MDIKTDSLLLRFAIIFLIFVLVTLIMSSFNIYYNQTNAYKKQCEDNMQNIAEYLKDSILMDSENFLIFQEYFLAHHDEILIPYDFDGDYQPARKQFEKIFAEQYPEKTFGVDVRFSEMSDEVKLSYVTYRYEYWLSSFTKAGDTFGLEYVYYITPTHENLHMYWLIETSPDEKIIDGKKYIQLCSDFLEPLDEHEKMWEAWSTGKIPKGYDTYDNEYGKTYAYYTPIIINGKTIGVLGTEIAIANVNKEILNQTVQQMSGMGMILIICAVSMLLYINQNYIEKLSHLQANVRKYSQYKDPAIAAVIEKEATGYDEISALAQQVAAMILELENYMNNLMLTARELSSAKVHADSLHKLAHKDALTGVQNKTAYDAEIRRIEWQMTDGYSAFGVAMIDLNYLKRINDTFGHEQGNIAIKKLCHIVCSIFENSPVFRIGGDEFVVILEGEDYTNVDTLVEKFKNTLEELKNDEGLSQWERVSASIGVALYNPVVDSSFDNVFKRADKLMYKHKKEMKAMRTD